MTVANASVTHSASKEGGALFQKTTNVPDDTVIGGSIKRTTDVWPHLLEVFLPVPPNDLQLPKASNVFICIGGGMKCRNVSRYLCKLWRAGGSCANLEFQCCLIGEAHHNDRVIDHITTIQ